VEEGGAERSPTSEGEIKLCPQPKYHSNVKRKKSKIQCSENAAPIFCLRNICLEINNKWDLEEVICWIRLTPKLIRICVETLKVVVSQVLEVENIPFIKNSVA
jgi:hypothetical protein